MGRIKRVSYMDEILRELIATLPTSPTVLDKIEYLEIHRYISVPTVTKSCGPILGALADIRRVLSLQIGQ